MEAWTQQLPHYILQLGVVQVSYSVTLLSGYSIQSAEIWRVVFVVETVQLLLSHRSISPNGVHPPGSGTTPLHLAASLGRADVVNLLLEQEGIDDSLRDSMGKTCRDLARGKEVSRTIDGTLFMSYTQIFSNFDKENQFRFPLISQCILQIPS